MGTTWKMTSGKAMDAQEPAVVTVVNLDINRLPPLVGSHRLLCHTSRQYRTRKYLLSYQNYFREQRHTVPG